MASAYDYAIIRVVPRVDREEFVNVGILVSREHPASLAACIELDESLVLALDPTADTVALRHHLDALVRLCEGGEGAGPLACMSPRERFHWLTAPKSSMIQTSVIHMGIGGELEGVVERLMSRMVRRPVRESAERGD